MLFKNRDQRTKYSRKWEMETQTTPGSEFSFSNLKVSVLTDHAKNPKVLDKKYNKNKNLRVYNDSVGIRKKLEYSDNDKKSI